MVPQLAACHCSALMRTTAFCVQVSNKYVRDKIILVLAAHALHFVGPAKFKVRPYLGAGREGRPQAHWLTHVGRACVVPGSVPIAGWATPGAEI